MNGGPHTPTAGGEDSDLAHHLLSDLLVKGVIVIVALLVLAVGMVVVWRTIGREGTRRRDR
ncbi:hypothetical protein [Streptosporangium sp. NPDC051022]|uniref:hypothetical protein n=1 Tax=Streptosporangium sp. NPDC051022 TaxID=3155752 RepID=UPI00344514A7